MHCSIVRIKQISMQRTPLKIIATLVVRPCQRVYKKKLPNEEDGFDNKKQ